MLHCSPNMAFLSNTSSISSGRPQRYTLPSPLPPSSPPPSGLLTSPARLADRDIYPRPSSPAHYTFGSTDPFGLLAVEKKLKSGIRVRDYVPSFGERKNDVQTAAQCKRRHLLVVVNVLTLRCADFAQHFKEIAKQSTTSLRPFRVHLTSVIVSRCIGHHRETKTDSFACL